MLPEIALVHELMRPYLPESTALFVELCDSNCQNHVIMRLVYTSKRSGRTMAVMAKGDTLPTADDSVLAFYRRQLVLTPHEVLQEFSKLYFLERRAKQEAWLALGKHSRAEGGHGDIFTVVTNDRADALSAVEYSPEAGGDAAQRGAVA